MDWPANPFWDYAVELYGREGVEAACLELQRHHALDVNVVLLCCWLASRGMRASQAALDRIARAAEAWQEQFVRPLRAVRSRLKLALAQPQPGSIPARWPGLAAALRRRVLALEIDGERMEQLLLAELAADLPATATPGVALAAANLRRYWRFAAADRVPLATVVAAAFPEAPESDVLAAFDWLQQPAAGGQPLPHR